MTENKAIEKDNTLIITADSKTYYFNKFDFSTIPLNARVLLVGKSKSGKSWVIKDIMYNLRDKLKYGLSMCPTDGLNKFYPSFIPESFTFDNFDINVIKKLLLHQEKALKSYNKKKEKYIMLRKIYKHQVHKYNELIHNGIRPKHTPKKPKVPKAPNAYLIMDDCLGDKKEWNKSPIMQKLLFQGRHYKLLFFLTTQYLMSINKDIRSNFEYIIFMTENIYANKERLYEHAVGFSSKKHFINVFDLFTDNYRCMIIHDNPASKKTEDCVFWYRARDLTKKDFKLGEEKTIDFNNKHVDHKGS